MMALVVTLSSLAGAALLIALLYILSLMTGKRRTEAEKYARAVYAHRGLHNREAGVPENSILAFEQAVAHGYGIELDVQLSKDGVPMVFHDYTLIRVCGVGGNVSDYTAEELRGFTLSGAGGQHIPTLSEVLKIVDGRVPLLVEIKAEYNAIPTTEAAQNVLDGYSGAYCIESFNPFVTKWYKNNRPAVVRGLLSDVFSKNKEIPKITAKHRVLTSMALNFLCKPDFIAYNYKNRSAIPLRLVRKLYRPYTFAWTVRDTAALDECADFDSIIFENVEPI